MACLEASNKKTKKTNKQASNTGHNELNMDN